MIVVTGGAGFIGSNLVAALEARDGPGHAAVIDHLGDGDKWKNLSKRAPAAIVPPERIFEFLAARCDAIDVVFHLGAISTTTETDVDLILEQNFRLPARLWDWCHDHNKRLIYASSAATYGDGAQGFDDDPAKLDKLQPLNPYGWSKHLFDRHAMRAAAAGQAPPQWAGLKFFNVYGPNEYHKGAQRSVAHKLHARARQGLPAELFRSDHPDYADGGQLRDFIHVDDCVAAMLWLAANPRVNGIYNVGTGKARSFIDLARAVTTAAGRNLEVAWTDMPPALRGKYQSFTEARMDRLRAAGFTQPPLSIEDGVARYVAVLDRADPYI